VFSFLLDEIKNGYSDRNEVESFLGHLRHTFQGYGIDFDNFLKGRILDVGTGYGYLPMHLQNMGMDCYGIDLDSRSIAKAKTLAKHPERLVEGDICNPPFEEGFFDLVLSTRMYAHIDDIFYPVGRDKEENRRKEKQAVVSGISRVTKTGGLHILFDSLLSSSEIPPGAFETLFTKDLLPNWYEHGYGIMALRKL